MQSGRTFADIATSLGLVRARTETAFLETGKALAEAVEILSAMGGRFEAIVDQLQSSAVGNALADLAWAARQVGSLGTGGKPGSLAVLLARVERLLGDIDRMVAHARSVDALTINAKIVAADLAGSEIDVSDFAREIGVTLALGRDSLQQCRDGLAALRQEISVALAGQLAADQRRDDAARTIPSRLQATLDALAERHRQAREAATLAGQRNESVRRHVCDLITALQIGDSTRQRIEHVEAALAKLASLAAEPDEAAPTCAIVVTRQAVCRLQAAQLDSADEQYRRETRIVGAALERLAEEAGRLRGTGRGAVGDAAPGGAAVEAPVEEALAIFADFEAAQGEARRVVEAVREATAQQARALDRLHGLEADLRIMGLNTTLKCSRIGQRGRALSMIAQELRLYARQFGRDAQALFANVGLVAKDAAADAVDGGAAGLVAGIEAAMTRAMQTLRVMGSGLDQAYVDLDRDGARVESLLAGSASGLAGEDDIDTALREGALGLDALAGAEMLPEALPPQADAILAAIAHSYTMAEERVVHARILAIDLDEMAAAPQTVDDMLF